MKVNVYIQGVWVGSRDGCDALVNGKPCRAPSASVVNQDGLQRHICEGCLKAAVPGKPPLAFGSHCYEMVEERHEPPPPRPDPAAPPLCPACGKRSFVAVATIAEAKPYAWDQATRRFTMPETGNVEQKTILRCADCGTDLPADFLGEWI